MNNAAEYGLVPLLILIIIPILSPSGGLPQKAEPLPEFASLGSRLYFSLATGSFSVSPATVAQGLQIMASV